MTDRYKKVRKALAMGPTPGPWSVRYDYVVQAMSFDEGRLVPIAQPYGLRVDGSDLFANAALVAACDPDTIRELLAERDQLAAALEAAREDALRLDALEAMVNESPKKAFLLHHGMLPSDRCQYVGLGLSNTGRTLRQAIDQARGKGVAGGA